MAAHSFPLLRLPPKNLASVLRQVEIIEQIGLSLLSNKTKEYIKEFCDFKGYELSVWLHPYAVELELFKIGEGATYCSFGDGRACAHNEFPDGFTFDTSQFFDMKSCLKHLLYILNPSRIASLFYIQSNEVSNESQFQMAVDCLKGIKILKFTAKCIPQMNHIVRLVNAFPQTNILSLVKTSHQPFQLSTLRQILLRKTQKLKLVIDITLNELLLINSPTSDIYSERLRGKDINLFLKHWAAGLKPELEYISFQIPAKDFAQSTVLAGIPHRLGWKIEMYGVSASPTEGRRRTTGYLDFYISNRFLFIRFIVYM